LGKLTSVSKDVEGKKSMSRWLAFIALFVCPLEAGATDNFRYDLQLLVNDKPVNFHIPWRCKQELEGPNFGPGGLIRSVMKPTISVSWIARRIPSGAVIFSPLRTYCVVEDSPVVYDPEILLVDNTNKPSSLQIFTRKAEVGSGYTVHIVTSSIVRLSRPEPDYAVTVEEREVMNAVRHSCSGYQGVFASIYPESNWGKSSVLSQEFSRFDTLSLGPFAHLDTLDIKSGVPISLVRVGNTWQLPSRIASDRPAKVYFPIDGPRQTTDKLRADALLRRAPPTSVEIDGAQIPVTGQSTAVYYPRNRWFMFLMTQKYDCWGLR
jgi:hypothetical protein